MYKDKILKIESELKLSPAGMAKAMKITTMTYYNKKNAKVIVDSFNEKNYTDLAAYLKKYIENI